MRSADGTRNELVSHIVLEADGRPQPTLAHEGLHSCDRPLCCNKRHLRWGTKKDNTADMVARGRSRLVQHGFTELVRGELNVHNKLAEEDVRALRVCLARGDKGVRALGRLFKVTHGTVISIRDKKTWGWLS